jgi:hypothetical protein
LNLPSLPIPIAGTGTVSIPLEKTYVEDKLKVTSLFHLNNAYILWL